MNDHEEERSLLGQFDTAVVAQEQAAFEVHLQCLDLWLMAAGVTFIS